jgi:WG repeat protein
MRITTLNIIILLFFCHFASGQTKFKVQVKETDTWRSIYSFVDEQGKVIRQLDTSLYYVSFNNEQFGYFAVFGKKGSSGWTAIDANENVLFKVYNTSFGEPSPDDLIENKIRIVDENENIGFANNKGEIIIKPQFEIATSFHNGKAIIGETCKKIPWDEHEKESDCHHYSIECKTHGYINEKGIVIKQGDFSFEQIMKEIDWKVPDE